MCENERVDAFLKQLQRRLAKVDKTFWFLRDELRQAMNPLPDNLPASSFASLQHLRDDLVNYLKVRDRGDELELVIASDPRLPALDLQVRQRARIVTGRIDDLTSFQGHLNHAVFAMTAVENLSDAFRAFRDAETLFIATGLHESSRRSAAGPNEPDRIDIRDHA